jgi:hypothetical protein
VLSEVLNGSVLREFISHELNSTLLQVIRVGVMLGEDTASQLGVVNSLSIEKFNIAK